MSLFKSIAAFGGIEDFFYLVPFKTDDFLVVLFGQRDFGGDVCRQLVFVEIVLEKTAYRGNLSRFSALSVGEFLPVELVESEIFHKVFEVRGRDFLHIVKRQVAGQK